jgi:transposase
MRRHALSDREWAIVQAVLPKKRSGPVSKLGDRLFIEAVLFRAKTGTPWRELHERLGPWKSVYNRFNNWAAAGVWEKVFRALQPEPDKVGSIVDGTVIRAHQDAAGGKGGSNSMLGSLSRRCFHEDPCPCRYKWTSSPHHSHPRPKARNDRSARAASTRQRQSFDRRHRI